MTSSARETDPFSRDWSSRLESWKEIATYLGRDVRTAIRWERERGLPVHRVPGGRRQAVYAFREELDAWLAGLPSVSASPLQPPAPEPRLAPGPLPERVVRRPNTRFFALAAIAVLVVAAVTAVLALGLPGGRPVAHLALDGGAIVARDASGREKWRHPAGTGFSRIDYRFVDFDRTGRPDIVALLTGQEVPAQTSDRMLRFSPDGRLRWTIEPTDALTVGGSPYGAPWFSGPWTTMTIDGEVRLVWAVRHVTWWPAMLLTYDADGKRVGMFFNAGWIHSIQPHDGRVLIAGVSNSADAAMAALIDARHPSGSSPEDPARPFFCATCPQAPPMRYATFARSEINRSAGHPINTGMITRFDGGVELRTHETQGMSAEVVYELSPDLSLLRGSFGDRYWELHQRLETEGLLSHPTSACRERATLPPVRVFAPGTGWH